MMERVAARGPVRLAEGEDEVTRRLERASVRAAAGDFHAAAERFEAALDAATEAMDNKSLARAHCAYHAWFAMTKLADDLDRERARDGNDEDAAREDAAHHRARAASHASTAMNLLEFRLLATLRDARTGESPPSSLFELTDEESRFFDVLLARGLADELWTFLGAPLAVTLARELEAPRSSEPIRRRERRTNPDREDAPPPPTPLDTLGRGRRSWRRRGDRPPPWAPNDARRVVDVRWRLAEGRPRVRRPTSTTTMTLRDPGNLPARRARSASSRPRRSRRVPARRSVVPAPRFCDIISPRSRDDSRPARIPPRSARERCATRYDVIRRCWNSPPGGTAR